MRAACLILFVCLVACAAVAPPSSAAEQHLEAGTLVEDGSADQAVLVLLYVPSGHKEAQSVYVVRPVARCGGPGGSEWYGPESARDVRSAPQLEMQQVLGPICPCQIATACAAAATAAPPLARTGWARLLEGTLKPFAPLAFPPFVQA